MSYIGGFLISADDWLGVLTSNPTTALVKTHPKGQAPGSRVGYTIVQ
jgi:hypothetical protein